MAPRSVQAQLEVLLRRQFNPVELKVVDDSDRHAGHQGHSGSGSSHFSVSIVSEAFEGKRPLQRHRMVYAALREHMSASVHALSIAARTPSEAENAQA